MNYNFNIQIIEPPIYEEFNWEMDRVMSALEYIRQKLPSYLKLPKSARCFLYLFEDKFGGEYPVIAVGCPTDSQDFNQIPDFHELYERVERIINEEITIDKIKEESIFINAIPWKELQSIRLFPENIEL